jgi:zinc protease
MRATTLDNGLKVLVREEHTAPLASVWCWYKVGSRDERPGCTGVSHWVEHMNFKGTENIPRDQVKGIIEQFGGTWNGYTWIDQTTYLETATRDALDRMLFIEAERMARCLYHPDDCESERTVIISELQGGENDPDVLLDQELTATAFKAHPYRHPTIGWLSDLQSMTREDLYSHYRTYYVPNNATLVIVGDVDADEALRRADAHFGRIPPGDVPLRQWTAEPAQTGERRLTIRREGTAAYLKAAYHAPAAADAAFFPALVLDAVLTGAKGVNLWSSFRGQPPQRRARLYRALVDRRLASSIAGQMVPTAQPFLYTLSATATAGTPLSSVESVLLEEIEAVRLHGVTAAELARAKKQLQARFVFDNDSITNIAHQLGFFDTVATVDIFGELSQRVDAVTLESVADIAARMFPPSNRTVGWFDPLGIAPAAPKAVDA